MDYPAGRISHSLIERFLLGWHTEVLANFVVGLEAEGEFVADPGFCKGLRIIDRHNDFQRVTVQAMVAFLQVHVFAVGISEVIDPCPFIETGSVYDKSISVPFSN